MPVAKTEKYKILLWAILTILFSLGYGISLHAQFYNGSNMTFGKNRVQYRDFLWTYYKYPDFNVYFYRNGKKLAQFVAEYAHEKIPEIESRMGTNLSKNIKFIVFNNLTDLKQSNIGLTQDINYNTGGITYIIGTKVILYFDGNYINFERQIREAIAEVLFKQMMFGGTLGQQIKTSAVFSLPKWFEVGFISYSGEEWNVEFDNRVRDGILSGRYKKLNNLTGEDAVYAGHSLWRFLANRYGKEAVSGIVRMVSVSKDLNKGFVYVIGLSFKDVVKQWKEYYENEFDTFTKKNLPDNLLHFKYKSDRVLGQPKISPDGKLLAFTTNERGKYKIYLYDFATGKKKKIFKKGIMIDTKTDYSYPLITWHPTGKLLAFVIEDKGMPWLYFYDMEKKKLSKRKIFDVQKILSFNYSDDGRFLLVSAVQKGQSDIFVFNIAAGSFYKITDDIFSDLNPVFINNSTAIVFSSNRKNDTLDIKYKDPLEGMQDHFDLFMYDYLSGNRILKRLTDTPLSDETQPENYGYNTISYLSDESGIVNAKLAKIDSVVSSVDTAVHYRYFITDKTVSDYAKSIIEQNVNPAAGKKAMIIYDNNLWKLYFENIDDYEHTPSLEPALTAYKKSVLKEKEKALKDTLSEVKIEMPVAEEPKKHFRMIYIDEKGNETVDMDGGTKGYGTKGLSIKALLGIEGYENKDGTFHIPKRRNYRTQYSISQMVSQVDFNYINYNYQPFTGGTYPIYLNPGFNILYKIGLTDLMENHRFVGGVRFNFSLINNEYLFSYADLEHQLDKEIVFHTNSVELTNGYSLMEIHSNELYYLLKWPFNEALSVRGTFQYRNNMFVTLATDQQALETPTVYENWLGVKGELVYDGTRKVAMNIYYGSRWKIFAEYNQLLFGEKNHNLAVFGFDFRNYKRIHRTFIWANRIAGSTSMGTDRLIYYMGGVDNWLAPKFNQNTPIDFNKHYAYQTLATPMRGFDQNIRNGTSFVVLNSELRFPLFQYFSQTPLSSSFLRNFQIVAFGDVGTAWTGLNPYDPENSLFTNYIDSGPLHISVEVQKEPIVAGFGAGARMHLFGYFVRGDVSWGVEDGHVNKPIYYLSLSLDF